MADDRDSREKQADDAERRQRERALATELERGDEPEPPVDTSDLAYFETELEAVTFPATGSTIVAAAGDQRLESDTGTYRVAELVPDADIETFDAPAAVRTRVQHPTVAEAMKRIVEAGERLPGPEFGASQRDAYERTFRELASIDTDDENEGVETIADWVVERIDEKRAVPGSRDVRRQAAKFCRANGYSVRNDEWLGI